MHYKLAPLTSYKDQKKTIDIENESFEMIYFCTSNRYIFNRGTDIETQYGELHSLANFPDNAEESFLALNRAVHENQAHETAYYYGVERDSHPYRDDNWTISWHFKNAKNISIPAISALAFSHGTEWVLKVNGAEHSLTENKMNSIKIEGKCDEFFVEATFRKYSKLFHQHFSRDDPGFVVKIGNAELPDKSFIIDSADYEVVYTARNNMYYINGTEEPNFDSRAITGSYGSQVKYMAHNCCVGKEENDYIPRTVSWSFRNQATHQCKFVMIYFKEQIVITEGDRDGSDHVAWVAQIDQKFISLKPNAYNLGTVLNPNYNLWVQA